MLLYMHIQIHSFYDSFAFVHVSISQKHTILNSLNSFDFFIRFYNSMLCECERKDEIKMVESEKGSTNEEQVETKEHEKKLTHNV